MKGLHKLVLVAAAMLLPTGVLMASNYSDTRGVVQERRAERAYANDSYGYAVFPTIGKGGLVVKAPQYRTGHVYEQGKYIGNTSMTQVSVGAQAGGQAYSQIWLGPRTNGHWMNSPAASSRLTPASARSPLPYGLRLSRHRGRHRWRERRQERRPDRRPVLQGHGGLHHRQRRRHVRGHRRGSAVLFQTPRRDV